jgi:putative FmdB family regulatory protein
MPIYEYSCKKCGKTIEVIQKFSDAGLKKHEGCGGALTKLISASGFHFKGTGWYVTDYARKSKGGATEGKESKESSTKTDSATKESSPAAPAKSPSESGKKSSES